MSKAVLITGGSRGIGRAIALVAARRGWSVGVNYRADAHAADDVVRAIAEFGRPRRGAGRRRRGRGRRRGHVRRRDPSARARSTAVVANAGVVAPAARLVDMSAERMRRMFDVNVLGTYLTAREAARRMSTVHGGSGGSIVLISSAASRLGSPDLYVDYAGSKGAIDTLALGLSRSSAREGVRVNAVRPGSSRPGSTPTAATPTGRARSAGRRRSAGPGTPEEIAEAASWLMSDAASYVTGAILDVAGGR